MVIVNALLRALYWVVAWGPIGFGVIAILSIGWLTIALGLLVIIIGVLRVGFHEG